MYNAHRGMLPQHAVPNGRLTELLESIKTEFETQAGRVASDNHDRDQFVNSQLQELDAMRHRMAELEQTYRQTRESYERQVSDLKRELDMRGPPNQANHVHNHGGPSQPAPPSIGHGPRDLFGQIMQGGQGQAPLGPPPQEPQQPQGLPAHLTQNAGLNTGPPPSHAGFGNYPPVPGPALNGYAPGLPPSAASPGPAKPRGGRSALPGTATPLQNHQAPYPGPPASPRTHAAMATSPAGHRQPALPSAGQQQQQQPQEQQQQQQQQQHPHLPDCGNELWRLFDHEDMLPDTYRKKGDEWAVVFNPKLPRSLDIQLLHTLRHTSVVCCVRFSHDGNFIATGCNRIAQIFDVNSGQLVSNLADPTADKEGDLYIRSVCFSPDGVYLATGAEDRIIRVWDIDARTIRVRLEGHLQDIYSLDFSSNGRTIASGSGDKTVRLWDVNTGREQFMLEIEDGVTTVALSQDGRLVAAGSLDRSVRVWDTETAAPVATLFGHEDSVYSVAFAPNGRDIVSGSLDRTIKMWQLPSPMPPGHPAAGNNQGKCVQTFKGHADFVLSVALTADGKYVLSGSKDRGVQFWDPHTGEAALHLQGHRNSVISVAPSPGSLALPGHFFATGSGDQNARIWRYTIPPQDR